AEHRDLWQRYSIVFRELNELRKAREELLEETTDQNLDLWRHQLQELESVNPQPSELQALQTRYSLASNARRLIEVTGTILQQLSAAEDSILKRLAEISRLLREVNRLDDS